MTKASDLLVAALEAEGARFVFGIPGEENLDLLESLRNSGIELVLTRHEQAAGFMAATVGRLTGHAGICLSTLGPGATNLVTAAAYAQLGAMPMLMLTGQKPIRSSRQAHFQIVDVVDMMRPLTKYTRQLVSADSVPARVREAVRLADGLAATPDDAEPDDLGPEDAMREATIPIDGPAMEGGETDGEDASAWADGTPLQVLLAPQPEIAAAFDAAWAAAFDPAIEAGGIERLTRQSLRVWRRQLRRLLADEAER